MSSSVTIILDAGQNLAGVTKSYVDLSVKPEATNGGRQAAVYGYLGVQRRYQHQLPQSISAAMATDRRRSTRIAHSI
jgi:CO dehydrogenase/acetyl-CoA synthase alpha subunit